MTTGPLLGDVQFYPILTPEQHQFNGLGHTIDRDSLVYSTGRAISVSAMSIALTDDGDVFYDLSICDRRNLVHIKSGNGSVIITTVGIK